MRNIKTLIMESISAENGATGNFWIPKIEVWDVPTGKLNVVVRLFATQEAFSNGLKPLETKLFKESVTDWQGKSIEEFAFDLIKAEPFFATATEQTITI